MAQRLGRHFVGTDLNREYVELARKRVQYRGDDRRMMREREISKAMSAPQTLKEIADRVYSKPNETLQRAAERNLLAHLLKLEAEGKAAREGDIWSLTPRACCSQVESLGVPHAAKSNS